MSQISHNSFSQEDHFYMQRALKQAEQAFDEKEVPIGAIIVHNNQVIGKGYNQVERTRDATAHAEIIAIGSASEYLNNWRLNDSTIYITLEPCLMCAGALLNSRISRIVFGAKEPRTGVCESHHNIDLKTIFNSNMIIQAGLLNEQCKELIQLFFAERRQAKQ